VLSGWSMAGVAFDDREAFYCRACTVKRIGEAAVQRLEAGLSCRIGRWTKASRYQVDEMATDNGYEYHDLGEMDHPDPPVEGGEQAESCEECGVVLCFDCGARLDTTPEEEAGYERRMAAAGKVAW
jgi:hypothetical protein